MTTPLRLVARFLVDYARNPVNLLLLAVVPTVFVVVVAGRMAEAAELLGGPGGPAVETAAAGWAAAFLAGISMYFQIAATHETDARLVIAGLWPGSLVLARLVTGLALALGASGAALIALVIRTGIDEPARVVPGTVMFAVIYVAVGAVVGTFARNPVNGTVIVLFVWIIDVFFGPAMGAADRQVTRGLPTHYVTLWMVDLPSRHGGRPGDFGWAVLWTLTAVAVAWSLAAARVRTARPRQAATIWSRHAQLWAAGRASWQDARRNPAQWVLFVVVPLVFILGADAVTPDKPLDLLLRERGSEVVLTFPMPAVHGVTMAPIAIAALSAVVGLFVMLDSRAGDSRAALAGLRPGVLLSARFGVLALLTVAATAVSLATTALVVDVARWPVYAAANLLVGLTYGLVGALLAPLFGRVGGVFLAFLLPFLDLAIVQSAMLNPEPTTLSKLLPGYGGSRLLIDAALTDGFDEAAPLLIGVTWLLALVVVVAVIFRHSMRRPRMPAHRHAVAAPG